MNDYKSRMIEEHSQLKKRIGKLRDMLINWRYGHLDFTPDCPYDLLRAQLYAMKTYESILRERARFERIVLEPEESNS